MKKVKKRINSLNYKLRHSQKKIYSYKHYNTNPYQKFRKNFDNIFRGYLIFHLYICKQGANIYKL